MQNQTSIKSLLIKAGYSIVNETDLYIEGTKPLGFDSLYFRIGIIF